MPSLIKSAYFNREDLLQLFNLKEEKIEEISVSHKPEAVYIYIKLLRVVHNCPVCDTETDAVKDYTDKKITHSLLTNYPCFIMYKARRHVCPVCNKTFYEKNPFVHKNMKISVVTVSNVLQDLKSVSETFTSVANRYNITSTTAAAIFDSHVFISRKVLPEYLCIDECYAYSGDDGKYVCVLIDFITKETTDLLSSRKKEDLVRYFDQIPLKERERVKMVCIDMWDTYRIVAKDKFPECIVAVDKFHILQELNRKIKRVRIRVTNENKSPKITNKLKYAAKQNDKEARIKYNDYTKKGKNYYLLRKFEWLLYLNSEKRDYYLDIGREKLMNRRLGRYLNYNDLLNLILEIDPDLVEARDYLLSVDYFFREANIKNAREKLNELIEMANTSSIKELNQFGMTLIRWKNEIVNSFHIVETIKVGDKIIERKINNGIAENKNRTLKLLKNHSNGYKSWDRFRNRALYVLNEDATYSLSPLK